MVTGVGTDLIEKSRVLKAIAREGFLKRTYTKKEQELIEARPVRAASNFAAKEAVAKAFGCGFSGIRPEEIEVLRHPSGQPYVVLYGAAKEKADALGVERIFISITDTDKLVQAVAVLEGRRLENTDTGITGASETKALPVACGDSTDSENEIFAEFSHGGSKKLSDGKNLLAQLSQAADWEKPQVKYAPALTAAGAKEVDRRTMTECGIPSLTLMERAAGAVTERVLSYVTKESVIGILCGTGNNGGDGLAVARQLAEAGYQAKVFLKEVDLREKLSCTEEFLQQLLLAKKAGVLFFDFTETDDCDIFVDALFGIGLAREISGIYKEVIQKINALQRKVIAVDIASGISADTGEVCGVAIKAAETVTFGAAKCGHLFYPGKEYTGNLFLADIGFPKELLWENREGIYFAEYAAKKEDASFPVKNGGLWKRPEYSNKGTFGKVAILAGSKNMAGAAYFSAYAAGRSGAGLIKIVTPECNREILQVKLPEAMLTTYGEATEKMPDACNEERAAVRETDAKSVCTVEQAVAEAIGFADALVIGPGIGKSAFARRLVQETARGLKQLKGHAPVSVWDADALNLLSEEMDAAGVKTVEARRNYLAEKLPENAILTPHPGELSRLTGLPASKLVKNLLQTAELLTEGNSLTFVLKDAVTVVASGTEKFIQTAGNSGMATGGSGDVLTGVIAALAAWTLDTFFAASHGVWIHGLAGDAAAGMLGEAPVLASDIAYALSRVINV